MRQPLEHLAARAAVRVFTALTPSAGRRIGSTALAAAHGAGFRRAVVRAQIAAAFPDRDAAWVRDVAEASFRHFGAEAAVIARLQSGDDRHLLRRTATTPETDAWIERMKRGEGVIVVTGHIGNWEVAGAVLADRGVPLAAVVKRQRNRAFDEWLAGTRRRLGIEPIYMEDARRRIPRMLSEGRSIALVADQDARSRGLVVTFLGRPASTFRGPARLAIQTGAPLVFGYAVRTGDGYEAAIEPVREAFGPASVEADEELALTRAWVERLERQVRRHPEQYFWFHRRWKSAVRRNASTASAVPHADPSNINGKARKGSA